MTISSNVQKYLEKLEKSFKVFSQCHTLKDQLLVLIMVGIQLNLSVDSKKIQMRLLTNLWKG